MGEAKLYVNFDRFFVGSQFRMRKYGFNITEPIKFAKVNGATTDISKVGRGVRKKVSPY